MTDRLYYRDSYLWRFRSETAWVSPDGLLVRLSETAFYPTSGGQLFDLGTLNGIAVTAVEETDEGILHHLAAPITPGPVEGAIDEARRFAFMQQHTGQHLLSAVVAELYGAQTVAVHLGEMGGTIELAAPPLTVDQVLAIERSANQRITANLPVSVAFEENPEGLRKASAREGQLRIVSIEGLDRSACGGTHVSRTGEIGVILLGRQEKIRGNTRLEFVAGSMAVRRARHDYDLLTAASRALSRPFDEIPTAIATLQETSRSTSKELQAYRLESAAARGRREYSEAPFNAAGVRRHWARTTGVDELVRATANAFIASGPGIYLATANGAALLVASPDAGIDCGALLRQYGKGGGSAFSAQGHVPDPLPLAQALALPGSVAPRRE